jgi:hypothetical protein
MAIPFFVIVQAFGAIVIVNLFISVIIETFRKERNEEKVYQRILKRLAHKRIVAALTRHWATKCDYNFVLDKSAAIKELVQYVCLER